MKFLFLGFALFGFCLSAFGDPWRVEVSKSPPGAYVFPEKQGAGRDALVGWVGKGLAQTLLGTAADWSAQLDKLKTAGDDITEWENVGIVVLASNRPAALRLNTTIQEEWAKANKENKAGKLKCWWADRSGALATARVAVLGLTTSMNQEDLGAYNQNQCQNLKQNYYPTKATPQVCVGRVLCKGQDNPTPVVCDVAHFENFQVFTTGDPSQVGRCPAPEECLSQYNKRSFPMSGPAARDPSGESGFSGGALRVGRPGSGGICFYETPGSGKGKKSVLCFTADGHCPSLETCQTQRSCQGYAPAGW